MNARFGPKIIYLKFFFIYIHNSPFYKNKKDWLA